MWISLSLSFEGDTGKAESTVLKPCQPLFLPEWGQWWCQLSAAWLERLASTSTLQCGGCRAPVCLVFSTCRVVKGKRDRRAARHCASCASVTTPLPIKLPDFRLALMRSLWKAVTNPPSQIMFHRHLFVPLTIAKVSFCLISCPVCRWTCRALEDRALFDFNEAFSFQLSWAQTLFGSDKSSRVLLNARKQPQALRH